MRYEESLNNLKQSINKKGLNLIFAQSIKELKNNFGVEVSTKFLRNLSDLNDNRKKSKRINYLLRKSSLTTKRALNFYKEGGIDKYRTEVIYWGKDEKIKPFNVVGLTDRERRQIAEIKQISEEYDINLFNRAEESFNNRQKKTGAFNIGGGAVIRDIKIVDIGRFSVVGKSEVLFIVE